MILPLLKTCSNNRARNINFFLKVVPEERSQHHWHQMFSSCWDQECEIFMATRRAEYEFSGTKFGIMDMNAEFDGVL